MTSEVNEIALLVWAGVASFIFAMKTTEAPFAFIFYTIVTSTCFAVAVRLVLTHG
jgi:hypothetical protein